MRALPDVYSIPPSCDFLATLAGAILDGRLPGGGGGDDPLALADLIVLLPNRRACRGLREAFLAAAGTRALVLPDIRPIGDVDLDDLAFADPDDAEAEAGLAGDLSDLPAAIGGLERRLGLAHLVAAWGRSVDKAVLRLGHDEPLVVSTSPGDALALAGDLMRLMDQVETEKADWSRLGTIAPETHDAYFAMTRDFLAIASAAWPAILAERGLVEPATRRDALIAAETRRLAARDRPILAAGSTGSILATRDLLAMVARHPKGALVLPGLDRTLSEADFATIGDPDDPQFGHPNYGLKRLIEHVGVTRADVVDLVPPQLPAREAFIAEAMRPAPTTARWAETMAGLDPSALDGVAVIAAANEQEEALALALALRETAENPAATAALVTPDRALARRVAAELSRWDVAIDDSGGLPLSESAAGVAARLVAALGAGPPSPVDIAALLTHPALFADMDGAVRAAAADAVDLAALRGLRPAGGVGGYAARLSAFTPSAKRSGDPPHRMETAAIAAGVALLRRLEAALAPLAAHAGAVPLGVLARAHRAAFEALAPDPAATGHAEFVALLDRLGAETDFSLGLADYPAAFDTLAASEIVRRPADPAARIRILGLPEARLLGVDHVVLGGLVEGVWPMEASPDPWLNRSMRRALGVDPPERRMGLAAHDFVGLMGAPRVTLSFPARRGDAPSVPSRWLKRLEIAAGKALNSQVRARGAALLAVAQGFDGAGQGAPIGPPEPRPPVALRPARLSVTEIATLQRDPYAIYARHVLRLHPLDPRDETPGAAERGEIIHKALGDFVGAVVRAGWPADPLGALLAAGDAAFAPYLHDPSVRAAWLPRFRMIARWFLGHIGPLHAAGVGFVVEQSGQIGWTTRAGRPFTLVARADRFDLTEAGLVVIDYKTGATPGKNEVAVGLQPQLTLQAAMAVAGAFAGVPPDMPLAGLLYIKLGGGPAGEILPATTKGQPIEGLPAEHLARLKGLIDAYETLAQSYRAWAIPQFMNEYGGAYDALSRVGEWGAEGEAA